MFLYRTLMTVAAFTLATSVFAAEPAKDAATPADAAQPQQLVQTADAKSMDTQAAAQPAATEESHAVNINKASAKDLMKVEGISKAKANAIVNYRKKHGNFKSVNDLKKVKGFKKMKAAAWDKLSKNLTAE